MKLSMLLSVPHAGTFVPPEVESHCRLAKEEIIHDGDEGSLEIYALKDHVAEFVTTKVARAIVDVNRAEDDRRPDGVIKTHTCWNAPVYREFPTPELIERLLKNYYRPYHNELRAKAQNVRLGIDCHTMAVTAPPIDNEPGKKRPQICLGDLDGASMPSEWSDFLVDCLAASFACPVSRNVPFKGGFITQTHKADMPWAQIEISRDPFLSNIQKRECLLRALETFEKKIHASRV